jgi:hypothetical protein
MWTAATVVVCALDLLGRSAGTFPSIRLTESPPPGASAHVEGFVPSGERAIYLVTSSSVFRDAQASLHQCGNRMAIRKLASILVHEEWHVRNGPDERGAYLAQLTALAALGAGQGTRVYGEVRRAMQAAVSPPAAARLERHARLTGRTTTHR